MRRKFIRWLSRRLGIEIYFELTPIQSRDLAALDRDAHGMPVYYVQSKLSDAVWPKPDKPLRLFIQW